MSHSGGSPGPISDRTFEFGLRTGVAGGIACVALLYWTGVVSLTNPVHTTVTLVLFPVYVLSVAVLLGLWLGYDTDETNLKPVTVEDGSNESEAS
ncbi:hypothetical protein EKH57_15510 [Halorubrum sp. BOL3-1]|uniref:hypothetical protein n=1 Tax=Halorubrum sp. BOL3-1 TaxID=2497325 RepID=UPI001005055A|nr:hypothetical protein [Halorubrum sp. BOL3-1]QAU14002.1 hypothetical protein EKH57_15510 [Halorubrum sp. BOL3-1]